MFYFKVQYVFLQTYFNEIIFCKFGSTYTGIKNRRKRRETKMKPISVNALHHGEVGPEEVGAALHQGLHHVQDAGG